MTPGLPLTQLRLGVYQEDHELRAVLFGGDESTSAGAVKGEANRLAVADALNRMVRQRLDLVGEISALRGRVEQAEKALAEARDFCARPPGTCFPAERCESCGLPRASHPGRIFCTEISQRTARAMGDA